VAYRNNIYVFDISSCTSVCSTLVRNLVYLEKVTYVTALIWTYIPYIIHQRYYHTPNSYFELDTNPTKLPKTFDTSTAVSIMECCVKCDMVDQCVSVAYNDNSRQCLLSRTTNVTHGTIQTIEPAGFQVFKQRFVLGLTMLLFYIVVLVVYHFYHE